VSEVRTPGGPTEPQLSTSLLNFSAAAPEVWGHLFERARLLDAAGVDRLVVSDHVVFGEHLSAYGDPRRGGVAGGVQPTGPDGHWLEPMTTLSVLAGMTSHIRLGTNILIAALRRPVVLAKAAATLDVLSGGRLDLWVGVGWQREEYQAAGLDFSRRGRLLDETLEVCRTLWREPRATLDSAGLDVEAIHMMPKPVHPDGVPIWVAGTINPRVVERLGRFGTGWIPWGADAADPVDGVRRMRQALTDAGHDPTGPQVVGRLPTVTDADGDLDLDRTMAAVPDLVAAGITDLRANLRLPADPSAAAEHLHRFVAAFRRATDRPPPPNLLQYISGPEIYCDKFGWGAPIGEVMTRRSA
jgi:probable F420-dependent oxidoreductase